MKKILLPVFALLLTATTMNAQSEATDESQTILPAHGVVTETTGDATKITGADEVYDFYVNVYDMDMDAAFSRFTAEDLEPYVGYKVVGISVAGLFGSETTDFMLNLNCNQTFGENVKMSSKNVAIAKGAKSISSVPAMSIYTWNDAIFETPYIIPAKKENAEDGDPDNLQDVYAGYSLKDSEGKMNVSQLLVAQPYDSSEENPGWFCQQTGSSTLIPRISGLGLNLLPVKLILEKGDATGIESAKTSADVKESARYTLDGKRIYLPAKGINIVKMSDGTTHKVVNK